LISRKSKSTRPRLSCCTQNYNLW